jgi:hypothetical protein
MTTQVETDDLRRALEALWTDMGVLARSPLVEQLGLVEGWSERDRQDAYKRASALIDAILDAAQRLKSNGGEEVFALLDRVYGLNGAAQKPNRSIPIQSSRLEIEQVTLFQRSDDKVMGAAVVKLMKEL